MRYLPSSPRVPPVSPRMHWEHRFGGSPVPLIWGEPTDRSPRGLSTTCCLPNRGRPVGARTARSALGRELRARVEPSWGRTSRFREDVACGSGGACDPSPRSDSPSCEQWPTPPCNRLVRTDVVPRVSVVRRYPVVMRLACPDCRRRLHLEEDDDQELALRLHALSGQCPARSRSRRVRRRVDPSDVAIRTEAELAQ